MQDIETIMQALTTLTTEKQVILEQETALKNQLRDLMQSQSISKLENTVIRVNLVNGFIRNGVDADKLRKQYPDIAKECAKETKVDPFVKVTVAK